MAQKKAWVIHFNNPSQKKSGIIAGPYFDKKQAETALAGYKSVPSFAVSTFTLKSVTEIPEPKVQLHLIYNGGSIDYWPGHSLPCVVVTLYRTTNMRELYEAIEDEAGLIWETLEDKYGKQALEEALFYFYQTQVKGRTKETFARFSREETRNMDECGEGSAYVFVFGRLEIGGPFKHPYIVYP